MKSGIIEIEGICSSLNNVQAQMLANRLEQEGRKTRLVSFPAYHTTIGRTIANYLAGSYGTESTAPEAAALFFTLDRYQFKTTLEKWLREGNTIIADRYTYSNVYEAARLKSKDERNKFLHWMEQVEARMPRHAAVVLLDIEAGEAVEQDSKTRTITTRPLELVQETRKTYASLARRYGWTVIDCTSSKNKHKSDATIHDAIVHALQKTGVL